MAKTIVGVFDDSASAQDVVRELNTAGIPLNQIQLTSNADAERSAGAEPKKSWSDRIMGFYQSLFEDEEDRRHADTYAEAWRRGHFLVIADVEEAQVDRTVEIMNRHGSVDIDQRADFWRKSGYSGSYDREAPVYTAEQRAAELASYGKKTEAAPVVQEELAVGKRLVRRGGVRIHSYVRELPVAEVIRLREERVNVERRPVDREIEPHDAAFQERTIDVTAEGEEAVVEKRARVVEEVLVGKDVEQREETIRDTVRRKDVEVERLEGDKAKGATTKGTQPDARR